MSVNKVVAITGFILFYLVISFYDRIFYDYLEVNYATKLVKTYTFPFFVLAGIGIIGYGSYFTIFNAKQKFELEIDDFKTLGLIVVYVFLAYSFVSISAGGSLLFINRVFGEQKEVKITGVVIDTHSSRSYGRNGKWQQYSIKLESTNIGRYVDFNLTKAEFDQYHQGDRFNRILLKGCLGLLYSKE